MARRKRTPRRRRFRARAASLGRRVTRRARRFTRRTRGRSLGLVGKTGVGIAAGAPLLGSALDAGSAAVAEMRVYNLGLLSTAEYGFWRFLNGITSGFGMGNVRGPLTLHDTSGNVVSRDASTAIPSGTWYKTLTAGGILVGFDIAVSWAGRKLAKVNSGVRFMGTKLTGGK